MEARQIEKHKKDSFAAVSARYDRKIAHKSPSLTSRLRHATPQLTSPIPFKRFVGRKFLKNSELSTPLRFYTKLPSLPLKQFDISKKAVKNVPARFLHPTYTEINNKIKMETPMFDLMLLREINCKLDKEMFDEDQRLFDLGFCYREIETHVNEYREEKTHLDSCRKQLSYEYNCRDQVVIANRVKRVRFQIV